ncbi:MAG: acyl--CoA ligase [Hyphomicrobiales bacterium]|nr:acyl--CoA ligase [Hyphomicrobiales bacterium]
MITPPAPKKQPEQTIVEWVSLSAKSHPQREAVVCENNRLTWAEFDLRANKVANGLLSLGLGKGDRVAILAATSIEYIEIFMGTLRAGGCLVPLSGMTSSDSLEGMMANCGAKFLMVSKSTKHLMEPFVNNLKNICSDGFIAIDFIDPDWVNYENWLDGASNLEPNIKINFEDTFNIIYSSGTTGVPKGILHDHQMRAAQMERIGDSGFDDNSRTLLSTPLYSNTTIVALLPTLVGGGTLVLMTKFDAARYLQLLQEERCTHTMLVPVQYKRIMELEGFEQYDLSSMRMKFSTSAPLRAALKRDVLDRFPGGLTEIYGLTEGGGTTVLATHLYPDKLESVGQPSVGVELRFIDDNDHPVEPGTTGEICGRSPTMMKGYYGRDDLTKETLWQDKNGDTYLKSGDMGFLDEDGFLYLSDRKKDMIISGGLNVYANDLELALLEEDDVEDAAVIGIPSEDWGETPLGFVVLCAGSLRNADSIRTSVNQRLGKSQRISHVLIQTSLPRSQIGKILKRELKARFNKQNSN